MKRAGFTILELLLVMALLGVILGAGIGMFAGLDLGKSQAAGLVKNVLRSAQNSAILRQAPACVRIDRAEGTMTPEAMKVIGTWHFENRSLDGAFDLGGGRERGVEFTGAGFIGDALRFDGRPGSLVEFPIEHDPSWDFTAGFAIDVAVRKEVGAGGYVVTVGEIACIDVTGANAVRGWFVPTIYEKGVPQPGGRVMVASAPGVMGDDWVRVRLEYDRSRLRLSVDGVPVAELEEEAEVWKIDDPLVLSHRRHPFTGSVDNLVVSAVVVGDVAELPESVLFTADTPEEIHFDAGGRLDRDEHPEPVKIELEYEDGSRQAIWVGVYGTVEG
ncbi:MAG: prepilin-type N-terminal cleavage/methylation domain-containing protein [Planctomycetota bacterium]|nr:prepilin-type N-terminal cleavage/methylation domain-containing protein [Planctomycetota bacterium]